MRKGLQVLSATIDAVIATGERALALLSGDGADRETGLQVSGLLHVNVNCSDFERSRAFYERLGFRVLMKVDKREAADVASAVGMHGYVVHGALMAHKDGSVIDLLQWDSPVDERPPYDALNHLGIARIAMTTTDMDADIARLKAAGVAFISAAPASVPDPLGGKTRFICFKDPDGTVLELVEMGTIMGLLQRASALARRMK
jgi:catechol 2,3-dioxygenase-like lactoylglutathione lyase family enzyme